MAANKDVDFSEPMHLLIIIAGYKLEPLAH